MRRSARRPYWLLVRADDRIPVRWEADQWAEEFVSEQGELSGRIAEGLLLDCSAPSTAGYLCDMEEQVQVPLTRREVVSGPRSATPPPSSFSTCEKGS